jgi:delta 1-pyrroline-5-carboxylate dehydrogenase
MALAACGGNAQAQARTQADAVTRAIYADDVHGVTSRLESSIAGTITRAQVGTLSDKMHALGAYQGLQPGNYRGLTLPPAPKSSGEHVYQAIFARGVMFVAVKLAPDGRLLAYRVMRAGQ